MYNSGFRSNKKTPDGVGTVASQAAFVQLSDPAPAILSWSIQGSDDRALDPAGGQTVVVKGAGFTAGMTVTVGTSAIGAVTIVNSSRATFTAPAKAAGNYTLTMANSNGQAAILVPGLAYSTLVTWTTPAGSIGDTVETTAFTESVVATADSSITYALASGSLPTGATLNANGTITGTAVSTDSPTTYSFSIVATDEELQDSTQSFTITVNPDSVTWVSPAAGASISLAGTQAMSNITLSATAASGSGITYAANALPTGVTLSGSTISGTPSVAETVSTLLTATANTTSRYSTETITWVVSIGDTYWPYVSLLLNGSTPTTTFINDASLNNTALTIVGDTRPNNFNPYSEGYYSNYFDGTGDYLSIAASVAQDLGTSDFTYEFYWYPTTISSRQALFCAETDWWFGMDYQSDGKGLGLWASSNGSSWDLINADGGGNGITSTNPVLNNWNHIAIARTGGTWSVWLNGTRILNLTGITGSVVSRSTDPKRIGTWGGANGYPVFGYISNSRLVIGSYVYDPTQASITPPTSPLTAVANTSLLTCQSNQFIDNSVYKFTITKNGDTAVRLVQPFATPTTSTYNTLYSVYNTGTTGYVDTPTSSAFAFGTGDFTIECWIYIPSNLTLDSVAQYVFDARSAGAGAGPYMYIGGSADLIACLGTSTTGTIPSLLDSWTHLAYTRSSGTAYLYRNGTQIDTGALSTDFTTDTSIRLGAYNAATVTRFWRGYISNFRVVKGQALYTGTFTPPTATLTADSVGTSGANVAASITGTVSLLCHQNNTIIDNSPNNFTLTTTGTKIQPVPQSPFTQTTSTTTLAGLGAAYFDGTGDYLRTESNPGLSLGTGDYSIECWVYSFGWTSIANVFTTYSNNTTYQVMLRYGSTTNQWNLYRANATGTTVTVTDPNDFAVNCWTHHAICRSNGTLKWFINGKQVQSVANTTDLSAVNALDIGRYSVSGYWSGYIADFRMIVGTALYTAPFTPPQAPLAPVANTQLLTCQYNGGANNNGFVDQSSYNNIITRAGNTTQGTFSPFSQTGWSNYFNGSTYFYGPAGIVTAAGMGTGFSGNILTIETWIYPTTLSGGNTYSAFIGAYAAVSANGRYWFGFSNAGNLTFTYTTGTGSEDNIIASGNGIIANQWHHVAVTIDATTNTNSTINLFLNGTRIVNATGKNLSTQTAYYDRPSIGGNYSQYVNNYTGYLSNFRITKGAALYTNSYTPSTTPLTASANTALLTYQNNQIVDNSSNQFVFTLPAGAISVQAYSPFGGVTSVPASYSNYFDGTGDYLNVPSTSGGTLDLTTTSTFTVESWVYVTSLASERPVISNRPSSTSAGWALRINANGTAQFYFTGGSTLTTTSTVSVNTWNHLAVTRSGINVNIYINGVLGGSSTSWANGTNTSNAVLVGASAEGSGVYFLGYLSNVRVVNGTAVYTSAFTPPTSPLTAVSGTSLLTCQSNTIIDNSPNYFAITAAGNTAPRSFNPFGTTNTSMVSYTPSVNGGSMYFDGTGDYLTVPSTNVSFGTGDFTVECWIYFNSVAADRGILGSGAGGYDFVWRTSTGLNIGRINTAFDNTFAWSPTVGQWYHVAYSRSGTSLKVFVNGTQVGTTATNSIAYNAVSAAVIGASTTVPDRPMNGYISDLRLTNFSLYTSNFYPGPAPATPTTTIGTTTYASNLLLNGTSGGIIDWHSTNDLETVGNTRLAPLSPYAGDTTGKSLYFDGTTGKLVIPASAQWAFGTADFTVEFWMYTTDTGAGLITPATTGAGYWALLIYRGSLYWQNAYNASNLKTASLSGYLNNSWVYISIVRSSGSMNFYFNGVAQGTATADSTNYSGLTNTLTIGYDAAGNGYYAGYLKDLRITKGVARYTTTFTPPTDPDQTK